MAKHVNATAHSETPHVLETSRTNTIINALKRRAQAVLNDTSIDAQTRAVIRYGLETNDPWLAKLMRRAEANESIVDTFHCSRTQERNETSSNPAVGEVDSTRGTNAEQSGSDDELSREKIEALAEIICRAGDHSAAALFVLMGTLEDATHPKALANAAKHFAFMRCGESNIFGIVDAQRAVIEGELLRL